MDARSYKRVAEAHLTALGEVPAHDALMLEGLDLTPKALACLFEIDIPAWKDEAADIDSYFDTLGERLPQALRDELRGLDIRLISRWLNGGRTGTDITITGACGRALVERRPTDGRLILRQPPGAPTENGSEASPCTRCRNDCIGDLSRMSQVEKIEVESKN